MNLNRLKLGCAITFYEICRLDLVGSTHMSVGKKIKIFCNPEISAQIKKPTKYLSMKYVYSVVFVSVVEIKWRFLL